MTDTSTGSSMDVEKAPHAVETAVPNGKYSEGCGGDLQVYMSASDSENLKLAKDGRTVLIPQPSDDLDDPLKWSWKKKHVRGIFYSGLDRLLMQL